MTVASTSRVLVTQNKSTRSSCMADCSKFQEGCLSSHNAVMTGSTICDIDWFDSNPVTESLVTHNQTAQEVDKKMHESLKRNNKKFNKKTPNKENNVKSNVRQSGKKRLRSVRSGKKRLGSTCIYTTLCMHCNRISCNNSRDSILKLSCPYCNRLGGLCNWDDK